MACDSCAEGICVFGATGKAEPVGVDGKGDQVLDVRTITLESREIEGDDDRVVRRSLRAASGQRLRDIADQVWGMNFALFDKV